MIDLLDLPRTVVPAEFFPLVADVLSEIETPEAASQDRAVVRLEGAGGGAWNLGFSEGRAVVLEGDLEAPSVRVSLSVSDWREIVAGRVRDVVAPDVAATWLDPRTLIRIYRDASIIDSVRALSGDIRMTLHDKDEDEDYRITVTLGGVDPRPDDPTTTVDMRLEALARIARGDESPQQAFFAGRIRIDGDMNLAMGLMALVMA